MASWGLNSGVQVGGKRFYVQTNYNAETQRMVSQVFEDGKVIETREKRLSQSLPEEALRQQLELFHNETIADLELLFYIADKVKAASHAPSLNKLGLVFLKRNLENEAVECFSKAITLDANYPEPYRNLALVYLRKFWFDEAAEILLKALPLFPEYADLRNFLGVAYWGKKLYPEAINELEQALSFNSNYAEAHYNLGVVYLTSVLRSPTEPSLPPVVVRKDLSLNHLRKAMELNPEWASRILRRAVELIQEDKIGEALEILQENFPFRQWEVDDLFEQEFYLRFMFGGKSKDEKTIRGYVERMEEEVGKYPDYADLHNNLGIGYLIQCRLLFLKALEEFRRAVKLNPEFSRAKKNLKLVENEGKGFLILLRAVLK